MAEKSKLVGFVWKSQLLGISARKLWAWGGRDQNRGVSGRVVAGGQVCLEERAARPRKAPHLRVKPSGRCSIDSSPRSFIHSLDSVQGRNDKQTFIGYQPCAKREGRLGLLVPHLIFTITLSGSEYYFHPIKAEEKQVADWEGTWPKGTSCEEPERGLRPGSL